MSLDIAYKLTIPPLLLLTINKYISDKFESGRKHIKIISFISTESFTELFKTKLSHFGDIDWDYNELYKEDDSKLSRFQLKRKLYINEINNNFLIFEKENLSFIITAGDKKFLDSGIFYLAKKMYPKVIISYITSEDMFELLKMFQNKIGTNLYYKDAIAKKLFGDRGTDVKYKHGRAKKSYRNFEKAFLDARGNGQWIDQIEIFSEGNKNQFTISRDGIFKIKSGLFDDYLPIYERIGEKYLIKYKFFSHRSRKELPKNELRPIKLPFENSIFDDPEIRQQFLEVIENYSNCNYSIEYISNPHIFNRNRIKKLNQ